MNQRIKSLGNSLGASALCIALACATATCATAEDELFEEHHAHEHGVATLEVEAIPGRVYTLQYKNDLNGLWQALGNAHWDIEPHSARPALQMQPAAAPEAAPEAARASAPRSFTGISRPASSPSAPGRRLSAEPRDQ